jgi:7,8-dihydropterin-6-yl-methyl-4-(beta-D-ribofuranosyl)aminobenzene 5'-phosphate synthase
MSAASPQLDIGALKRVRILCISETSWFDNATLIGDVKAAGGMKISQYGVAWPPFGDLHADNAGGYSSLIEAEEAGGAVHRLLLDTGWGPDWMDRRFAEEGIDRMLQNGEIEALIISHEHFDHFWGIGSTLRHCPELTIYIPEGFQPEGLKLIRDAGHRGELHTVHPDKPVVLFHGLALANFQIRTELHVEGENSLYLHLADKGYVVATGCGHAGVLNLLDYAGQTFEGGSKIHAIYGGLHISPFGEWSERRAELIRRLGEVRLEHLGCNHCTGALAVQKMIDAGLPVVRGSARHGSTTDLFLGNGDAMELGDF